MILIGDVNEPKRATLGSAGYDFYAPADYELRPGEWTVIDTNVCVGRETVKFHLYRSFLKFFRIKRTYYTKQWYMEVVPRSGLSNNYGFRVKNTVGIIDQDYMDTIKVMVTVDEPYSLKKGERFLQGIVQPFGMFTGEIEPTEKRKGGHGSTGGF